jgi:hypothetical protein
LLDAIPSIRKRFEVAFYEPEPTVLLALWDPVGLCENTNCARTIRIIDFREVMSTLVLEIGFACNRKENYTAWLGYVRCHKVLDKFDIVSVPALAYTGNYTWKITER